jgi:hypothetical protein
MFLYSNLSNKSKIISYQFLKEMSNSECPICMEAIDVTKNVVVTDCGHTFHCSCLMQNAAHNGFGCPYCRTTMANEPPIEDDEEDDDSSIHLNQEIGNYSLTSFRMFMQRLNGEELEEEPEDEEDWETDEDEEEWETENEDEDENEDETPIPDAAYVAAKLMERGITYEDLVKDILNVEHSNWGAMYQDYDLRSGEVFGQFRAIISRYSTRRDITSERLSISMREERDVPVPVVPVPVVVQSFGRVLAPTHIPEVADSKNAGILRRRELMSHV